MHGKRRRGACDPSPPTGFEHVPGPALMAAGITLPMIFCRRRALLIE
jgi:hypothetical protein